MSPLTAEPKEVSMEKTDPTVRTDAVSDLALRDVVETIAATLPTGPLKSQVGVQELSAIKAFSFTEREGKFYVYVPKTLEKWADDLLVKCAIAAIKSLGAEVLGCQDEFVSTVKYDSKVTSYLWGIMWGLSGNGKLLPCNETSGSMGHGFHFVAHEALAEQLKAGTFWAKGKPVTLQKGTTGKAWGETLSPQERKIIALVTKAARHLDVKSQWASYFRSKESFLGHEVKKALPHKKLGILSEAESEYYDTAYSKEIGEYNRLLDVLKEPQLGPLRELGNTIRHVGQRLAPLCLQVDQLVSYRASLIFSKDKKVRKTQSKMPIKDIIARMGVQAYCEAFDPTVIAGSKAFRINDNSIVDDDFIKRDDLPALAKDYMAKVAGIRGTHPKVVPLCERFCAEMFGALPRSE
jgi:hypothetical protein